MYSRRVELDVRLGSRTVVLAAVAHMLAPVPCMADMDAATAPPGAWSNALLRSAGVWSDRMNGAIVAGSAAGLRVEVAPGREWAIAAVPGVALPTDIRRVEVRVGELGGGARWLVRLYGDIRGTGRQATQSICERQSGLGLGEFTLDPRLLRLRHRPSLQLQLGVEGGPGAWAVFESVRFLAEPFPPQPRRVPGQVGIECVDLMPDLPEPYAMRDWRAVAEGYDRLAFDFDADGQYLPLIWLDDSRMNGTDAFGIYSYVGDKRQGGPNHEGITTMGAVLGATLVGIDKTRQEHDYVAMCEAYYNTRNGSHLVLNGTNHSTGGSFWYEIWPHVVFYGLADRYPGHGSLDAIMRKTAERWSDACDVLRGPGSTPDWDYTAFDFAEMRPVDNGLWREPDAAAGVAWLAYAGWKRFGESRFLNTADSCLRFLDRRSENPYYEVLLPWGACTAARMNAELGRAYDLAKLVNWCFGLSDCRGGWGVVIGNWGGYDCAGLVGSVDNGGGYAFAMNTFAQAGALVPIARYDARYACAIGKWMLNLANAARLFYPTELPQDHQSSAFWKGDPDGLIAYEGLRREWEGKSPYATGDPLALKWGPETDLGLYGSGYVGFLGAIVNRTTDERILALDCLATDFFRDPAYPTYLVYNPYGAPKEVFMSVGPGRHDLYDAVSRRFVARGVSGKGRLALGPRHAAVVVVTPHGGRVTREGPRTLVDGIVVDFGVGRRGNGR